MLDEGSTIKYDVIDAIPRTPWAKENMKTMTLIEKPLPNKEETCYFLKLKNPNVTLENSKLKKRFNLSYSIDTLPYFVEWKSMACGDYVLGLEPASTELDDRFKYSIIKKGESKTFSLNITISSM